MSILTGSAEGRQPLDWALVALVSLGIVAAFVLGIIAIASGFVTTAAYEQQYEWISFGCGVVVAGGGAYLILELALSRAERFFLFAVAACGVFGYLAVSNGIPATLTYAYGEPGSVVFTVIEVNGGGKHCHHRIVLRHPHYSDTRMCRDGIPGPVPQVGSRVEIKGLVSDWGIARERVRAL